MAEATALSLVASAHPTFSYFASEYIRGDFSSLNHLNDTCLSHFDPGTLSRTSTSFKRRGVERRSASPGHLERPVAFEIGQSFEQQRHSYLVDKISQAAESFARLEKAQRNHDKGN